MGAAERRKLATAPALGSVLLPCSAMSASTRRRSRTAYLAGLAEKSTWLSRLEALAEDHDFLLQGDVFTKSQIEGYIELKEEENTLYEHTPHPVEFGMYYSC